VKKPYNLITTYINLILVHIFDALQRYLLVTANSKGVGLEEGLRHGGGMNLIGDGTV
jgi:hypothetical protein